MLSCKWLWKDGSADVSKGCHITGTHMLSHFTSTERLVRTKGDDKNDERREEDYLRLMILLDIQNVPVTVSIATITKLRIVETYSGRSEPSYCPNTS